MAGDIPIDFSSLDTGQLKKMLEALNTELYERSLAACDPVALLRLGFSEGFTAKPTPVRPWVVGGILIVPGYKKESSSFSHKCSFAKINDSWAWESEHKIIDEIRSSNRLMQSITLIALQEGFGVDVLTSKARNSVHVLENIVSYTYENSELVQVSSRNISAKGQL